MDRGDRRAFLTAASAAALLVACRKDDASGVTAGASSASASASAAASSAPQKKDDDEDADEDEEVGATEDLMREHGVIRRVLVVYRETAARLRTQPAQVPGDALGKAAALIRTFAEDYHEKQLEEAHLFPAVRKGGGPAAGAIDALTAQHQRGREITDFVTEVTKKAVGAANAERLARALESFARMYEAHAAFEDTIVFPAWKKTLSKKELHEMGEQFEDIEHSTFGKDGFESAVDSIGAIEKSFGIELAQMIAPAPPKG